MSAHIRPVLHTQTPSAKQSQLAATHSLLDVSAHTDGRGRGSASPAPSRNQALARLKQRRRSATASVPTTHRAPSATHSPVHVPPAANASHPATVLAAVDAAAAAAAMADPLAGRPLLSGPRVAMPKFIDLRSRGPLAQLADARAEHAAGGAAAAAAHTRTSPHVPPPPQVRGASAAGPMDELARQAGALRASIAAAAARSPHSRDAPLRRSDGDVLDILTFVTASMLKLQTLSMLVLPCTRVGTPRPPQSYVCAWLSEQGGGRGSLAVASVGASVSASVGASVSASAAPVWVPV
eukprot:350753-Chlamydomonas_euryale.AAC.1